MYYEKWDLESIFTKEETWNEVKEEINNLEEDISSLENSIDTLIENKYLEARSLESLLEQFNMVLRNLGKIEAFTKCKTLEPLEEEIKKDIFLKLNYVVSLYYNVSNKFNHILCMVDSTFWEEADVKKIVDPVAFQIKERKTIYRDFSNRYVHNKMLLQNIREIETKYFSEISSILNSKIGNKHIPIIEFFNNINSSDKSRRQESVNILNTILEDYSEKIAVIFLKILDYKCSKYNEYLYRDKNFKYAVEIINKMSINYFTKFESEHRNICKPLISFLEIKSKQMNIQKNCWSDLYVASREINVTFTFAEAKNIILSSFKKVDKNLYKVAERVFAERWIKVSEATHTTSGFCVNVAAIGESRIYAPFNNNFKDVLIIAHEIGHAFHNDLVKDLHIFNHNYSLCIAESMAIFCENIVLNEMISTAKTNDEKLVLIETKLQDCIFYLMEMYSYYLFERYSFEQQRNNNSIDYKLLCKLMLKAQKNAFNNSLSEYFPFLWMTQKHFYNTNLSFYNISYSVGYLINSFLQSSLKGGLLTSSSILTLFMENSGRMRVEELFKEYTDIEFMSEEFVNQVVGELDELVADYNEICREIV